MTPEEKEHDMFAYSRSICDHVTRIAEHIKNDRNALSELLDDVSRAVIIVKGYMREGEK